MRLRIEQLGNLASRSAEKGGLAARLPPVASRVSNRLGYRVRSLGAALALALAAAVLTTSYVRHYRSAVEASVGGVPVLVAARDIPAGTPGAAILRGHLLVPRTVPRLTVVSGAIASGRQLRRLVASERIYAREQVTTRQFRPLEAAGITGELSGNMRAIAVVGSPSQLLAGLVERGDRVDVVASLSYRAGGRDSVATRVILRNLLVLRPPGESSAAGGRGAEPSVVLALADTQAQRLFFALRNGDWSLVLRPFGRAADSPDRIDTAGSVLNAGLR